MAGYTRTDTANNIANGNVVDADLFDAEYNAIEGAFNATTGHSHDGSSAEGSPITKVGPAQDLIVSASKVEAKTNATLDLGSNAVRFKDAYLSGDLDVDGTLNVASNVAIGGNLTVTGAATINGNLTFGDSDADSVAFGADINSSIIPNVDNAYDLGSATKEWRNLYIDGTANIDTLVSTDISTVTASATTFTGNLIGNTAGTHNGPVTGYVTGTVSSLSNHTTSTLTEGTNLYYTNARARSAIGVTDAGGDGSLSYSSATGVITYTGPSATEVRNHFSAGTGVGISGGVVSIGQPVGTTSNVIFGNVTTSGNAVINGNLTVSGTTTTINTETVNIADNQIVLNSNFTGATPTQNGGIEIERGTQPNKTFVWDETADKWTVGSEALVAGSFQGPLVGNASTATALQTARTISLAGDVSGSVSFNGTSNVSITAVVADDSHNHVIGNIDGLQTALNAKADDSTTISAGGGLTGGGSLGANRTISHADTSSQSSVNNSGNKYIQDITVDTYGHITGLVSTTVDDIITPTSGSAPYYGCRGFVFIENGLNAANTWTGQNIASVVRNGTGDYTITFATAMPNANYAVATGPMAQGTSNNGFGMVISYLAKSASSFRVRTRRPTDRDIFDCNQMSFSIFA